MKVLQAAHISDDEYFSHMVLDDLNRIIRDIREAHKKDSESAPQTTVADELKENLEAVENFKGSRDEKLVVLYCKQLGINYKNLSDEEFRWLIRILKKSKKMGTPISQRKKQRKTAVAWFVGLCSDGLCCGYSVEISKAIKWKLSIEIRQCYFDNNVQELYHYNHAYLYILIHVPVSGKLFDLLRIYNGNCFSFKKALPK